MDLDFMMDLNNLIYFEFNNLNCLLGYFKSIGILNFVKSRSYKSEILHCKKKLQIDVVLNFLKNNYGPVFFEKTICIEILRNYSKYLFLYEYLKKGV